MTTNPLQLMAVREFQRQAREYVSLFPPTESKPARVGKRGKAVQTSVTENYGIYRAEHFGYYTKVIKESRSWPTHLRDLLFREPNKLPATQLAVLEQCYREEVLKRA